MYPEGYYFGTRYKNHTIRLCDNLKMKMIVTYDISEPMRLVRIAKVMEDFGIRVQKSVFKVELKVGLFEKMKVRIEREMEPGIDGVKYFPLCEKCAGTLEVIGQGIYVDPDEEFHVI
jgi:CRISPR-associated protein Cas2